VSANQGEKALALLRTGDAVGRDPLANRLLLAATAQVEGEAAARRKLDEMLATRPNDTELVLMAAQMHLAAREYPRARQLLQDVLQRNPAHSGVRLALARVQLLSGDRDAAVENLNLLRARDPKATAARLLLAQIALQRDDAKEAGTLIDEAVKGSDRLAETQNAAGLIYLETGRYDSAIAQFLAGTATDPSDATLWLNLGRAQFALEQNEAARESLQRALKQRANWLPAEGALAFLELQTGNSTAALKRVDALKTARPHDVEVLVLEADVRAALQQFAEADRALLLAARRQPSAALAAKHYQLRLAGELPKPVEPLEQWIAAHPDDLRTRNMLAEAYVRGGARQQAAQQYETILAREPRDAISLNNLAWLYLELQDRRAVDTARRASALAPNAPAISDTLGWVLVQNGAVSEGLTHLQRAAEGAPRNDDIQYHYAAGLAKAGKVADAQSRLTTLLSEKATFSSRSEAEELLKSLNKAQP
jgi:putative PEP-CTERM system TPR-repeat lipoprotein